MTTKSVRIDKSTLDMIASDPVLGRMSVVDAIRFLHEFYAKTSKTITSDGEIQALMNNDKD